MTGPEDAFPVSYLLAALWLRIGWLTPDDDELPPGVTEQYKVTGSIWRVLLDPFYQLHWLQLLIDSGQLTPPDAFARDSRAT